MQPLSVWAALALFSATAAAASSSAADRVTVESIHSLAARAKQWRLVGMPAATDTIRLTIAVSPRATLSAPGCWPGSPAPGGFK